MAERYWYGTIDMSKPNPVKRALLNIRELSNATVAGDVTTDEILSIDFDTALSVPNRKALNHNLRGAGYVFRRQETI